MGQKVVIKEDLVKGIVKAVTEVGYRDRGDDDSTIVFLLDDLTVVFKVKDGKNVFYSLVFSALNRDFIVTSGFEVLTSGIDASGESAIYELSDKNFISHLNLFLEWRLETLTTFSI